MARFINHDSKEPNLYIQPVLSGHRDYRQPTLALFANREIRKGDELLYDYGGAYEKTWLSS